jgi:hypothetical protein
MYSVQEYNLWILEFWQNPRIHFFKLKWTDQTASNHIKWRNDCIESEISSCDCITTSY